jgi:hypothetical protein
MKLDLNDPDISVWFDGEPDETAAVTDWAELFGDKQPYHYYRIDRPKTGVLPKSIVIEQPTGMFYTTRNVELVRGKGMIIDDTITMATEDERETFHVVLKVSSTTPPSDE